MTPETLAEKVLSATRAAFEALALDAAVLPAVTAVERPRDPKHGDYASNIAMQTAKKAGTNPRALAEKIAEHLAGTDGVAKVDIAGPGFLNITLDAAAAGEIAGKVVIAGTRLRRPTTPWRVTRRTWSSSPRTRPARAHGARPLGRRRRLARPCHAGLRRKLTAEYYVNDAGAQIDHFAGSLLARAKGEPTPENGYVGDYIDEIAADVLTRPPDALKRTSPWRSSGRSAST